MKRILFITPQPFFTERGSPYRVRTELEALVSSGYEVDLLSYPFGRDIDLQGVHFFRSAALPWIKTVRIGWSWNKLILDVFLFFSAVRLLLQKKYDVVHGIEEAGIMACIFSLLFKISYVYDMHSHMSEQLSQCVIKPEGMLFKIFSKIENFCMRRASGIVTVSDFITARIRNLAPATPVITLEDLPLEMASQSNSSGIQEILSRYELQDYVRIVYTGNFEPYQGVDLLLEAFASLKNSNPGFFQKTKLIIVGGGDETDERFQYYVAATKKLNIAEQVVFAGQQDENNVGNFLALSDILVSPRIAGAHTPLKIYSYILAKKPILATAITAHTNVLSNSNSFLAESDPNAFAKVMNELIELVSGPNIEILIKKVTEATKLLENKYNKTEFNKKLAKLYFAIFDMNLRNSFYSEDFLQQKSALKSRG
ncbi:MAG: glycosyltransferase [Proteobacteria bacterium]|nr:glycosyltransferase [Pseudomonadota bacterium]